MSTPPTAPPPPPPEPPRRLGGWLATGTAWLAGALAWTLGATAALALALVLAAWFWSATPQSLAHTLHWAADWLAEAETGERPLTVEGASGSLRQGGHVERLRWQRDGLDIELQGLTLAWPNQMWVDALLHRRATIDLLAAEHLRVLDDRPPQPPEPRQPPEQLELPWLHALQLTARLQHVTLDGPAPWQWGPVALDYTYGEADGTRQHQAVLQADLRTYGRYEARARLGTQHGFPLELTLNGQVEAHVPGAPRPQPLATQLKLQGALGGLDASLQAQASVAPADASSPHARGPRLDASATLRPWAPLPVHSGELTLAQLDLAALWPGAPRTHLSGAWRAESTPPPADGTTPLDTAQAFAASDWRLHGTLRNDRPGPWDRGALPLERLEADLRWHDHAWELSRLTAALAGGTVQATGRLPWRDGQPGAWQGRLSAQGLAPHRLLETLHLQSLDAELDAHADGTGHTATSRFRLRVGPAASGTASRPSFLPAPQLAGDGHWQAGTLTLAQLTFQALGAEGEASGTVVPARQRFDGRLAARAPGLAARFNGTWGADATRASEAQLELNDLATLQRWLQTTQKRLAGALPPAVLPPAAQDALHRTQWQGRARLSAEWSAAPPWALAAAQGRGAGPWSLALEANAVAVQSTEEADAWQWHLDQLRLTSDGEDRSWRLAHTARASGRQAGHDWLADTHARADGTLNPTPGGLTATAQLHEVRVQARSTQFPMGVRAELNGTPTLTLAADGGVTLGPGQLQVTPSASGPRALPPMASQPAMLAWDTTRWHQGHLSSRGQVRGLALSWINAALADDTTPEGPLRRSGLEGDLVFDGLWDLDLPLAAAPRPSAGPARGQVTLTHRAGDLTLVTGSGPRAERVPAGLREATLTLGLDRERLSGRLRWQSDNAGQAQADVSTTLLPPSPQQPQWAWPEQAPLAGQIQADLPQVGLWSRLAPPGWRVSGRLQARATLSGTRAQPEWAGRIDATELALRSLLDGIDFSDGRLSARLSGETLTIEMLRLRGAGGEAGGLLSGQGSATWGARRVADGRAVREPAIDLQLQARQLRLLARADRRLTLSGDLEARLRGTRLDLTGQLAVDQALLLLPDETTPTLGRDVVVRGTERPPGFGAGAAVQPQVRVGIDLGQNFRVRGLGIDTHLTGHLQVAASPAQSAPQLTGQVNTVRGSYRAYGQSLTIEQGRVRFNGPVDNPSLDILALRPHPTQRVGVQVGGTAQAPTVRLYSEPDLPDSEKLAWLVLGRPASGAGAEAAILQQAALALLSGSGSANDSSLTRSLGLDELSLQGETTQADGSTSAAALTLGKRISNQLYVTYSRSLAGAMGTVSVFYDLSRFVTLRAQAGDDNAIDLLFTHAFDGQELPPRERRNGRNGARTIDPSSP